MPLPLPLPQTHRLCIRNREGISLRRRQRTVTLPLAQRIVSAPNRHQFYTVRIADGSAVPAFKASGDITSMSQADGYIEIPAAVETVERGSLVEVTLF